MATFSASNTTADSAMNWTKPDVPALTTELVMELTVNIGQRVVVGKSDLGDRAYIPITGGNFAGQGIKGEVLPGGADWQLTRPDGVLEVDALYSIKTDDGSVIVVHNKGLVSREAATDDKPAAIYVRTTPTFQAPVGKYDWLNKRVFTGTITPARDGSHVVIRVFRVN